MPIRIISADKPKSTKREKGAEKARTKKWVVE